MSKCYIFRVFYDKELAGEYAFAAGPLSSEDIDSKEDAFFWGFRYFSTGKMQMHNPKIDTEISFEVIEIPQKSAFQEWDKENDSRIWAQRENITIVRKEGWNAAIDAVKNFDKEFGDTFLNFLESLKEK